MRTRVSENFAEQIVRAHKEGNFILAGEIINEARSQNIKIQTLAIISDMSTSNLSNLSTVAERATGEMRRWAKQGKLSFKALREIVRMPKQCRV